MELRRLLDDGAPIITVTGPTGIGKTTLAAVLAEERGAPFVRLAELRDLDGLRPVMSAGLQVPAEGLDAAIARSSLLVLDNAEHLRGLGEVLIGWTGPQLVVTSQRALGVPGEHRLALPPLDGEASMELLLDGAAQQGSRLDAGDPAVQALVRLSEGLPLALELAATRVAVTGPALLAEDPGLLHPSWGADQGGLDAAARRTWDLLSEESRNDLAHLAWFEHGFDARDAVGVLGSEALPRLHALLRFSCLREVGPGRFALFAPVRRFARSAPVAEEARLRWYQWIVEAVGHCVERDYGLEAVTARRRLRGLEADLYAAVELQDSPVLTEGLAQLFGEARDHDKRIAAARRWPTPLLRVRAGQSYRHLGQPAEAWAAIEGVEHWAADRLRSILAREAGDYDAAVTWVEAALQRADHDAVRALLHANLAQAEGVRGASKERIRGILAEAMRCVGASGDARTRIFVTYSWADFMRSCGDLDESLRSFEAAGRLASEQVEPWYEATAALGCASVLIELMDLDDATAALDRAAAPIEAVASATFEGVALRYRASIALLEGRLLDATEAATAAASTRTASPWRSTRPASSRARWGQNSSSHTVWSWSATVTTGWSAPSTPIDAR